MLCVELEKKDGILQMCFRLLASIDFQLVRATLKAAVLDEEGYEHFVYPTVFCTLKINERSAPVCIDARDVDENWNFGFEVCTADVVTEGTRKSPVFRAVLSHDMKEAREGLVEIPYLELTVVLEMLRYMYTDRVYVPSDTTEQLLVASDKYGLQRESDVARQVTVGSAADIAACAIVHSCRLLQKVYVA
ncbi:speckle-type POZ protein-like [Schistocerca serialis cubense]|uniref:speckle-type POZ protein-like n=1 Tax=Schistocerca serialis cubense TaxID=2023355 RepID=UPI00214EC070|nr:speckle-type POZ protein-like [Schistocerca serialis cubense]